jgi:hypothetical protein
MLLVTGVEPRMTHLVRKQPAADARRRTNRRPQPSARSKTEVRAPCKDVAEYENAMWTR